MAVQPDVLVFQEVVMEMFAVLKTRLAEEGWQKFERLPDMFIALTSSSRR